MGEIRLFKLASGKAIEIQGRSANVEKTLQSVLEKNLLTTLGINLLQSEYGTGKVHGGRIDTLGIDENNCPTIIEYKRLTNENVINQGLYYLDWLLDHKAEFELLVMKQLGKTSEEKIDWSSPRLICIAADFTKYDGHAVRQIGRNIDLLRYRNFGDDMLALELVHRSSVNTINEKVGSENNAELKAKKQSADKTVVQSIDELSPEMKGLFESLRAFILALGEDIEEKYLKHYIAFQTIKNFACVVVQKKSIIVYLNTTYKQQEEGFARDVSSIGHWGTGDFELTISSQETLKKAQDLIQLVYLFG